MNGKAQLNRATTAVMLNLVVLLGTSTARGQEPGDSAQPENEVLLGADVLSMFYTDYVCQSETNATLCVSPFYTLGFELDAFFLRPNNRFGVGLTGGATWLLGGSKETTNCPGGECTTSETGYYFFRTALALRYYIFSLRVLDVWASFETGFAGGTQTYVAYEEGQPADEQKYTKFAPELGLTGGLDYNVAGGFHVGVQLGILLLLFNDDDYPDYHGDMHLYTMGNGVWVQWSANLSYHFGL